MADKPKNVYPCWKHQWTIGASEDNQKSIADMESFGVAIDGNVEEWNPMELEGWARRSVTGKSMTITISGKRNISDAGNNFVADMALKTGDDCEAVLIWNFPSGAKLVLPCVINVTEWEGGETRGLAPLAFEAQSNGKPTFTAAAQ